MERSSTNATMRLRPDHATSTTIASWTMEEHEKGSIVWDTTLGYNVEWNGTVWSALIVDGSGSQIINHTALHTDDHAFEIIVDADGFGDVKAIDVDYITGNIAAGEDEAVTLINIDESLSTGGSICGFEVLSTAVGGSNVTALNVGVEIDVIKQAAGALGNATSLLNNASDVLTALSTGGAGNVAVFSADNDTVTIGFNTDFEEIEVIVDTPASTSVQPIFEHSTGVGTWSTFTPIDGTNGFVNTGIIAWLFSDIPTFAAGLAGEHLIRITRTRNNVPTTPIVDLIHVSNVTEHGWDKDGLIHVENVHAKGAKLTVLGTYADDTAAGVGALVQGDIYKTATGELRIKL